MSPIMKNMLFSLYQKARGYAYEATFHQAIATIKYKNIIDDQALINIVSELKDDLESRRLTEKTTGRI